MVLGPQFSHHTEILPISALAGIPGNNLRYDPTESGLVDSVKNEGVREPLILQYNQRSRTVRLGEGNHRLEAARRAGLTHVPVRAIRYMEGTGKTVRGIEPNRDGYVPGDLRPSQIMDWDDDGSK